MCSQHHAHHADSRWMVCSASSFSFVSQALIKFITIMITWASYSYHTLHTHHKTPPVHVFSSSTLDLVSAHVLLAYRNQPANKPGPHTFVTQERASSDVKACSGGWGRPPSTSLVLTSFCCAALQVILSSYVFVAVLQLKQRCEDLSHMARHLHATAVAAQLVGGTNGYCPCSSTTSAQQARSCMRFPAGDVPLSTRCRRRWKRNGLG
jgi:hypothetical protein